MLFAHLHQTHMYTYWSMHMPYIHTYIHTYTHTYIHTYTHTYIHTYIHTHTYVHTYIHTSIHTHMYIHTYIHPSIHTHTSTHTYIHISQRLPLEKGLGPTMFNLWSINAMILIRVRCNHLSQLFEVNKWKSVQPFMWRPMAKTTFTSEENSGDMHRSVRCFTRAKGIITPI